MLREGRQGALFYAHPPATAQVDDIIEHAAGEVLLGQLWL